MALALCAVLAACQGETLAPASPEPPAPVVATVDVDLAAPPSVSTTRQGYLHGVPAGPRTAAEVARVDALAPAFWRVSNLYDFAAYRLLADHGVAARHGTRIQWNLNDLFSATHGFPVVVDPHCDPATGPRCLRDFAALKTAWARFVEDFMRGIQVDGLQVDEFDFFSEPDVYWRGLSGPAELYELFRIAHDIVRRHRPQARIVAPSTSKAASDGFRPFFDFLAAQGLRLDAVSWHELAHPAEVAGHVREVRQAIAAAYAARPELAPREIHINEYGPPQAQLVPGWGVGWLAALENAGVAAAARACWWLSDAWSGCERGVNGLLLADQVTPQPLYWVYAAYAGLPSTRRPATASRTDLAALAGHDARSGEVHILLGRQSCGLAELWCTPADRPAADAAAAPLDVTLRIQGWPGGNTVRVQRQRIAGTSQPRPLAEPAPLPDLHLPILAGCISVPLPGFGDGEAYVVRIVPRD